MTVDDASSRLRDLLTRAMPPGARPHFVETHASILAFGDDVVYKVKKPVEFAFLDLASPDARAENCRREVALNRRLAPDVYLGVADLRDESGRIVDHAVVMRAMPADRRLAALVDGGADVAVCLDAVAATMARLHADSPRRPEIDRAAGPAAVAGLWESQLEQTRDAGRAVLDATIVERVERLVHRYLAGRRELFETRVRDGRACDGHGDLLAEDVFCLADGPRILDCLEFDDRLRWGDGLADVAFLAMDLDRRGRADLARDFLDAYASHRGDQWPGSLEDHWVAYRAHVRAKVACLRHAQGDADAATRARRDLDCAWAHLQHGRVRLVLVGGPPGTGKSRLAAALAASCAAGRVAPWPVLRSDVVRKEIAGAEADPHAGLDQGLYRPEMSARTYRSMLERAARLLRMGESVILDATWSSAGARDDAARVARETSADLVAIRCHVDPDVAAARVRERRDDVSDATPAVARAVAARFDPWPEAAVVDTRRDEAEVVADVRRIVGLERTPPADAASISPAAHPESGSDAP